MRTLFLALPPFPCSRSSKYQSAHQKETMEAAKTSETDCDHQCKGAEQTVGTESELEMNALSGVPKEPQVPAGSDESSKNDLVRIEEPETQEKQNDAGLLPGDSSGSQQESSFVRSDSAECQAESLVVSEARVLKGEDDQGKAEDTEEKVEEPRQQTKSAVVTPPEKSRRFTLDRLKQLGVDVSLKPQLGADKDSFVILEEPETNRGNAGDCGEPPCSGVSWQVLMACHHEGQRTPEKPVTTHALISQMSQTGQEFN